MGGSSWWVVQVAAVMTVLGALSVLTEMLRQQREAAHDRERLSILDEAVPDVLFETTPTGSVTFASQSAARVLGIEAARLRGMSLYDFTEEPIPALRADGPATVSWTAEWSLPNGSHRTFNTSIIPTWHADGTLRRIRGVLRDQAERLAVEGALRESEARFRRVLDAAQNGIMLATHDGHLLLTNDALRKLLGYSAVEMQARSLTDLVDPAYVDQLMALMASRAWSEAAPSHHEIQLVGKDGERIEVEISLAAFRERNRNTGVLIEIRDLTEARRTSEAIQRMSDYDRLTGLPNRDLFERHLQRALIDAKSGGKYVAVILIDLDRFKLINDTLGHPSGDRLLQAVAERLLGRMPPRHLLARFSGDEFLIMAPDLTAPAAAEFAAGRVIAAFDRPFELDGNLFQVSATAGVGIYPLHAEDSNDLVGIADAALHGAKADGGNTYRLGSNDANDPARRRLELEGDLRRAVELEELTLQYQPQVDPATGEVRAMEALLRWRHPIRGPVSPAEFVPLLEETGLIVQVGDMVLQQACEQARAWRDAGHHDLRVAVNLSPRQFLVSDLDNRIRAALERVGLPPEALEVELTETAGLLDLDSVSGVLNALIDLGVTTAIDDFGIGQSWLGRLQQFSIRTLKIDRSFIQQIEASGNNFAIVEAIVALGHALGMTIVAEGVETQEQLDVVRAIGCDLVQGFFYSPAVPADSAEHFLVDGFYRELDETQSLAA